MHKNVITTIFAILEVIKIKNYCNKKSEGFLSKAFT
jgi:hypothetical protein